MVWKYKKGTQLNSRSLDDFLNIGVQLNTFSVSLLNGIVDRILQVKK